MSKTKFYRQCQLSRREGTGHIQQVSFIPEEYAIIGNFIKLKNANDEWVDGWKIEHAGEKKDAKYVEENERVWTRTRKTSDI
jgi:hypothetical protein